LRRRVIAMSKRIHSPTALLMLAGAALSLGITDHQGANAKDFGSWSGQTFHSNLHGMDHSRSSNSGSGRSGSSQSRSGTLNSGSYTPSPPAPHPPSPEEIRAAQATELHHSAIELFNAGDEEGALPLYRKAAALAPQDQIIQRNLAHCEAMLAYRAGDYDSAIAKIRVAINLGRHNLEGWLATFLNAQDRERKRLAAEAIARHDAALTAKYMGIISRWAAEPQPSPISIDTKTSGGSSRWGSETNNLEAYVTGVFEGATPKGGLVDTLQSSAQAGSIYSRFVLGIASDVMAAINSAVHGDEAGAAARLQRIEDRANTNQRETDQYVKDQFATGAGQATGEGLLKRFSQ
jgi:hypothetical protein